MRIDPAIAALGVAPEPATASDIASAQWRERPAVAAILGELEAHGRGVTLAECPALSGLLDVPGRAERFAREALGRATAAIRERPLAYRSWRHFSNGVLHSAVLAASGRSSLSLAVLDGAAWSATRDVAAPRLVGFHPGELWAAIVAGEGRARILRNRSDDPDRAVISETPLPLAPGTRYRLDGKRDGLELDAVPGVLVTLRLHRRAAGEVAARQYDRASGALVHQAAAVQGDSRAELAMALLRAMERHDAAPAIAALARSGAPARRWQALREGLALDSSSGFATLLEVAGAADDPLSAPARRLAEALSRQHPALAQRLEERTCPA